ncbi:MAG: hypothetical protein QM662_12785, partial [Gordonia sp. (in: high G+C Gram-positive bacteria)]
MSSESTEVPSDPPAGEVAALVAVQRTIGAQPGVVAAARGLSHVGEHALGWLALSAAGTLSAVLRGDT